MYDYRLHWFNKASLEDHVFDKFISMWISFNGSYAISESGFTIDSEMVNSWSKKHQSNHEKLFSINAKYHGSCIYLKSQKVPKKTKKGLVMVTISDVNSCQDLFKMIYAVRCNLFHGNKVPADTLDVELVTNSYLILSTIYKID